MNNQQTAWIVAAVLIAGIIIATMIAKQQPTAAEPYTYTPPQQVVQDQNEQDAIECIAAGHTWTGYSCSWVQPPQEWAGITP